MVQWPDFTPDRSFVQYKPACNIIYVKILKRFTSYHPSSPCPGKLTGEPCITLFQYTSGDHEHRRYTSDPSEIVFEFQPGCHTIGGSSIFASQLFSFTMNSKNSTGIYFDNCPLCLITTVQNVRMKGINFVHCSLWIESVMNFTLKKSNFSQVQNYDVLYIQSSSAAIKGCKQFLTHPVEQFHE